MARRQSNSRSKNSLPSSTFLTPRPTVSLSSGVVNRGVCARLKLNARLFVRLSAHFGGAMRDRLCVTGHCCVFSWVITTSYGMSHEQNGLCPWRNLDNVLKFLNVDEFREMHTIHPPPCEERVLILSNMNYRFIELYQQNSVNIILIK